MWEIVSNSSCDIVSYWSVTQIKIIPWWNLCHWQTLKDNKQNTSNIITPVYPYISNTDKDVSNWKFHFFADDIVMYPPPQSRCSPIDFNVSKQGFIPVLGQTTKTPENHYLCVTGLFNKCWTTWRQIHLFIDVLLDLWGFMIVIQQSFYMYVEYL